MQDKETTSNSNLDAGLESSIANELSQGSRFPTLFELDLNMNVGEEDMDEDCLNPTIKNISVNGDHNKENLPKEIQAVEVAQKTCNRNAP